MFDVTPYVDCLNNDVPVHLVEKIIKVESRGNQLAINVNKKSGRIPKYKQPKTKAEAIKLANYYIHLGHTVDLGLMQVNSNNLSRYNVTVGDMFNACKNLKIGSKIYNNALQSVKAKAVTSEQATLKALSIYNTGNDERGFKNGYVARYQIRQPLVIGGKVFSYPKE